MIHPILNIAIHAARQASRVLLRYIDQLDRLKVSEKTPNDFVTQVDQEAEAIIIEHIRKAYPNHAILAEESGSHKNDRAEYTWIIDPLDGTNNYIHGFSHFAISIAVMKKDQVELGVIYDPIRQEEFSATRGQGAYVNNHRMRVSKVTELKEALIGTGFPFRDKEKAASYFKTFRSVFTDCLDIRRTGSAALDLAYVAAGRLDGFWESDLKSWDIAAGALMIQEAGGKITDFTGGDQYFKTGNTLAGNFKIHELLLQKMACDTGCH